LTVKQRFIIQKNAADIVAANFGQLPAYASSFRAKNKVSSSAPFGLTSTKGYTGLPVQNTYYKKGSCFEK
jgi:hypothetical protein